MWADPDAIVAALAVSLAPTIAVVVGTMIQLRSSQRTQKTTEDTNRMVNGQRTAMLALVAELRERIANENPDDLNTQAAAKRAREDYDNAAIDSIFRRDRDDR